MTRPDRIATLAPLMQAKARALLQRAHAKLGLTLLVTQALRTLDEQAALYAKGRDRDGNVVDPAKVVTNAPPGTSAHNYGLAFDVVPLRKGKPWWDAPDPVWRSLYRIAEEVGLDALGDPWGAYLSWDRGHFEEPGWKIVAQGGP